MGRVGVSKIDTILNRNSTARVVAGPGSVMAGPLLLLLLLLGGWWLILVSTTTTRAARDRRCVGHGDIYRSITVHAVELSLRGRATAPMIPTPPRAAVGLSGIANRAFTASR